MNQQTIIFDIGGLLVQLDGVPGLTRLLGLERDTAYETWMTSASVKAHETGKIDSAEFAASFVDEHQLPMPAADFLEEFREWPKSLHPGVFELFSDIPSHFQVVALSNMSTLHWEIIRGLGLASCFEKIYLSCNIGLMKPSAKAFRFVLNDLSISPHEALFLDDSPSNVEAATAIGLGSFVTRDPSEARDALVREGIIE